MNGSRPVQIKGYEIIDQIGEGAFGVVYRASQPQVRREVAIKRIRPEYTNRIDFVRRFETEAQTVAQLEHPYIVPLYDFWREEDSACLVMRLMHGSLKDQMVDRLLTLEEVIHVIENVCSALSFAHRHGVIHRDLKPANILLDEEGNAYLSDFGIAKCGEKLTDLTQTGVIIGSPGYLSPEQVRSEALTAQADIYSLGIMLYELVTGEHPFPATPPGILLLKHLQEPLPKLTTRRADLPTGLDDIIERATAKSITERFIDANAFLDAFRQVVSPSAAPSIQNGTPLKAATRNDRQQKGLQLHLLGDASISLDGEAVSTQLPVKAMALLVYLAVTGQDHSRESLAGLLWSDFPQDRARGNLRDMLASLKKLQLQPYLCINRRSVAMNPEAQVFVDSIQFQLGVLPGRGYADDLKAIEAVIDFYKGEFLTGFQVNKAPIFNEWLDAQRLIMHRQAVGALQQLIDDHLDAKRYEDALPFARRLLSLEPWMEKAHRNLMLLHFLQAEYDTALRLYHACKNVLLEELGVEPSNETQVLFNNIQRHLELQEAGPDRSPVKISSEIKTLYVPSNLPGQVTPFIGRQVEQRAIENCLHDHTSRLVTLMGVGGSGKTRLALTIGSRQTTEIKRDGSFRFQDGVYFVPLESVDNINEIVPAICQAINYVIADEARAGGSAEEQLVSHLREKHMLLILDNFEQLKRGVSLLTKILRNTQHVDLLVTSREKLGLQGERLFNLEGLTFPQDAAEIDDPDKLITAYSAPELFLTSARRLKSDFELSCKEIPELIRLCQIVDGLPLAVELAAGWTDVMPISAITAELEQELSILESRYADFPDRHKNMQAVFDVSWRQLTPQEREFFKKLCVFRGGFMHDSAAKIVGTSYRHLASLVNKSLIQFDEKNTRYQIHPLVRYFGAAELARNSSTIKEIEDLHCAYFCRQLARWNGELNSEKQLEAVTEFEQDSANVRSAWDHAIETMQSEWLDEAAEGLLRLYLWRRQYLECTEVGEIAAKKILSALSQEPDRPNAALLYRTLVRIQLLRSVFSTNYQAKQLVDEAFDILDKPELAAIETDLERAMAYQRAGDLAFSKKSKKAGPFYQKSLALYRKLQDTSRQSKVLTQLGWEAVHNGNTAEAKQFGEEALKLARSKNDKKRTANVLWMLGTLAMIQADQDEANRLLDESLDIRKMLGDRIIDIETGPLDLGMTLTWIGRFDEADKIREETLALYKTQARREQIAMAHIRLGTSKLHLGDADAVDFHARAGLDYCLETGHDYGAGLAYWLMAGSAYTYRNLEEARTLNTKGLAYLKKAGAPEANWVLSLDAEFARIEGDLDTARRVIVEALSSSTGALAIPTILLCLSTHINILLDQEELVLAAEFVGLLEKVRFSHSHGFYMMYGVRFEKAMEKLPPEIVEEAMARGKEWDYNETALEIQKEYEAALAQ